MLIRLADKVGFCFGVKRAVEIAEEVLKKEKSVYSLGSIIHNKEVVSALSRKGLKVIDTINDAAGGCIVVSSHGIGPKMSREISKRSLKLIDATCPFVSNAQKIAGHLSGAGYRIVIVGDYKHPEVKALVDFAGEKTIVVRDSGGIRQLYSRPRALSCAASMGEKVGVLSQTTQSMHNFLDVVRALIEVRPKELRVFNTICRDAEERQAAASSLARKVDLMLIVGGRHSANTKRLLEVCGNILDNSHLIETEKDLNDAWFKDAKKVGITSGASTPDWLVRRVADAVKMIRKEGCKH